MQQTLNTYTTGSGKDLIVFIHGNSSSAKVFEQVMNTMGEKHLCIAMDLPGCGESFRSSTPESDYTLHNIKNTVLKTIQQYDAESILVMGHSLGGHIALEIAAHIKNLKGLIFAGTPPLKKPLNMEEAYLPNPLMGTFFVGEVSQMVLDEFVDDICHVQEAKEEVKRDFLNTDPTFRTTLGRALSQPDAIMDEVAILNELAEPVFVIQTAFETMVNPDYLNSLQNITRTYEIDQCGHYPSLEQPNRFTKIMVEIAGEMFD